MTIERALINSIGSSLLATNTGALVASEVVKGCTEQILPYPVALEPVFNPIQASHEVMAPLNKPHWIQESLPSLGDVYRYRVWISPDQPLNWHCCELFLKQLSPVANRVGWEIIGNEKGIDIFLLCHPSDAPVVTTSFYGKFNCCGLSPEIKTRMSGYTTAAWEYVCFKDYYPGPPYTELLTCPEELHTSSYECLIAALRNIPSSAIGIYQALFQPVKPDHNWHRNIEKLLDLEYLSKLIGNIGQAQRYAQQAPSGDLRQMAGDVETKAHNDKPLFCAACRVAVLGAGHISQDILQSLSVFMSLFQHGKRPLNSVSETAYTAILSPQQIQDTFLRGVAHRPGFLVNSAELTGLVHLTPAAIFDQQKVAFYKMEPFTLAADRLAEGTPIGTINHAGIERWICIPYPLRFRHTHIIGRPDTGKTTLVKHMILADILRNHGVIVWDPHGDLVMDLLELIPQEHAHRVIYFDPGDPQWIPIWNPMVCLPGQDIGRITSNFVGILKSFVTGWGDRMEHILRNHIYSLLHLPGSTLQDIPDILRVNSQDSKTMRDLFGDVVQSHEARKFWQHDFNDYRADEFGPAKHKLSKLLLSGPTSLMLSQPNS
ncbi:hypothetical protein ACFL6U_12575, partial [Planctomycetota bacterium]